MKDNVLMKRVLLGTIAVLMIAILVHGNAGPFIIKYPNGDPGAKGVMARLDPMLRPARESRLRVVSEDLIFNFTNSNLLSRRISGETEQWYVPLVKVRASYTIENPTKEEISIDFGFPVLRGIDVKPGATPTPDVGVVVDGRSLHSDFISNSAIYGIIRKHARDAIEQGIRADPTLAQHVALIRKTGNFESQAKGAFQQQIVQAVQTPFPTAQFRDPAGAAVQQKVQIAFPVPTEGYTDARDSLRKYLIARKRWNDRDAALMVEYASLDLDAIRQRSPSIGRDDWGGAQATLAATDLSNMGALTAIGEQKATQLFAQLASQFDKNLLANYEQIFAAWGGDIRDRSVDMASGLIRLREINVPPSRNATLEPIYARVDYFDPNAKISETEKTSCQEILKNLPVVFTFAPMNLIHYQVVFPANAVRNVTVSYNQYAYLDTREAASYQLAYVLHPASLWKDFGPIQVRVQTPKGITCRASVDLGPETEMDSEDLSPTTVGSLQYKTRLTDKKDKMGELFLAVNKLEWDSFAR